MTPPSPFIADPTFLHAVEQRSIPVPCVGNRVLFRQGDECAGLYVLHSGQANLELYRKPQGISMRFEASDGSVLGLPAVISGDPYMVTAIARNGSHISFVTRSKFRKLIESDPALSFKALQIMAAELQYYGSNV